MPDVRPHLLTVLFLALAAVPAGAAPLKLGYSEHVRSDLPVLLLSGELDPATSPQQAESAIRTLSRARHVVIPDGGHGASSGSGECFDTSCLSQVRRPPFVTPGPAVTVLQNVSVIDTATGTVQPDMTVELSGDRIQAVVPAAGYQPPEGARIVDAKGRFLLPGFVEMHAHVILHPWDDKGQILPRYDRGLILDMLRLLLAHGITTVRDPGSETEAAVTLRNMLAAGEVTGPALRTAGRILTQSDFNPEPFAPVKDEKAVRDEIRWQAAAGVDFVKVYASMRPELMKIAIDEAHAHQLPVIGHLHRTTWTQAAELGIDMVTHAAPWSPEYLSEADRTGYDESLFGRAYWAEHLDLASPAVTGMAEALAKHGVSVDPTLIAMHTKFFGNDPRWLQHPQLGLLPELLRKGWSKGSFTSSWKAEQYRQAQTTWPKLLSLTKLLHDRGVLLTVGTDTPTPWIIPGVSFHEEMGFLRDAGIPAKDVLRMATLNGAKALGMAESIGAVKPGMRADLVVLRANPLEKIENTREIEWVIQGGKIYEPRELIGSSPR